MFKVRFLIFGLCAFLPVITLHEYERRSLASASIKGHATAQDVQIPAEVRSLRPNYPYSVIPGGVYSPAELRAAIQKDLLVRQHYAGFNFHSVQLVKLTTDQYQYASFRLKNRIFWTYKKLLIPKGEILVTDGTNYARTRCGNRLSDVPKGDTTIFQPSERLLSLPPFSPELLPQLPLAEVRPTPESLLLPFQAPRAALFFPTAAAPPPNVFVKWPPLEQSAVRGPRFSASVCHDSAPSKSSRKSRQCSCHFWSSTHDTARCPGSSRTRNAFALRPWAACLGSATAQDVSLDGDSQVVCYVGSTNSSTFTEYKADLPS
jgi:hypothetical protein